MVVGGLAIFAATGLDSLKSSENNNQLTALNWDTLIEHVKNQDGVVETLNIQLNELHTQVLSGFEKQLGNNDKWLVTAYFLSQINDKLDHFPEMFSEISL
ncbi:MAG: hypothetical protein LBP53_00680 [Candidatus Peribacteria bacterium]|nr:hypothetical protein [Candidatus Peribacteria bacterium]